MRRFDNLLDILTKRCPDAVISEVSGSLGVQILEPQQQIDEMKKLIARADFFKLMIDKMRLQLRYSVMALVSENRVTLFNDSLTNLMHSLLMKKWNDTESTANYAAFIIDKMHFEIDPVLRPN